MKLLCLTVVLILLLAFSQSVVLAAGQEQVVITAQPLGNVTCPYDFAINVVTLYEIELSWTNGANTTGTYIVAAFGRAPGNATDGFEVYSGNATGTTHWINTEFIGVDVYYSLYGVTDGQYSLCHASGLIIGGEGVEAIASNLGLFTFVFFALVGTIATYAIKRTVLAFITAGAWAVLAFYCFTLSDSTSPIVITDIYMALFWIGIAMVIVSSFEPLVMREKEEAEMPLEKDPWEEEDEGLASEYKRLRAEMGIRPRRPRRRERKLE